MIIKFNEDLYLEKEEIYFHIKKGYEMINEKLEIRRDPITGFYSRINTEIGNKPRSYKEDKFESKECIFCKENVFEKTPDFNGRKKYVLENTVMFPNLYPYGKVHLLIVPNYREHVKDIRDISLGDLLNSFLILKEYLNELKDMKEKYVYINLNKGLYAGASQEHLHFQIIIEDKPLMYHKMLIEKSRSYFRKYNRLFLEDFDKFEKENKERYIYDSKFISFISSFAPFRNNEVFGIVKSFGIFTLSDINLRTFAEELYKFLIAYEMLYEQFNMTIMDISFTSDTKAIPFIRIAQRKKYDIGFMEALNFEYVVSTLPEKTSEELRKIIR